jgi:hypothetical protein
VRDALAKIEFRNALVPGGVIRFGPNGQIAGSPYIMVQTLPGNTVRIIWPKKMPETFDAVLPMPKNQ